MSLTVFLLVIQAAPKKVSLVRSCENPRMIALLVAVTVLGLDQSSKQWALAALRHEGSTLVLPGPVDLTLVFNRSNAFGLVPVSGDLTRWVLAVLGLAVAAILGRVVVRGSTLRLNAVALALIGAGAVGNALDRIRFGAVVDFFDASKLGFVWVFNVADASIDVGVGFLLLATFLTRPDSNPLSPAADDRAE
jgi:signal peptidase II